MVSIDLHIHHGTGAPTISGVGGMPHLPKSMVKSKIGQADEGNPPYMPTAVTTCNDMSH